MYHIWYVSFRDLYIISDFFNPLICLCQFKETNAECSENSYIQIDIHFFYFKIFRGFNERSSFFLNKCDFSGNYLVVQALKG